METPPHTNSNYIILIKFALSTGACEFSANIRLFNVSACLVCSQKQRAASSNNAKGPPSRKQRRPAEYSFLRNYSLKQAFLQFHYFIACRSISASPKGIKSVGYDR